VSTRSSLSLDGLSRSQVKSLLGLATRTDVESPLPAAAADPTGLRAQLTELCQGQGQSGALLLDTVCEPQTSLHVLRGIKEMAKTLVSRAATESQRSAATVLYHAAIAAGAGYHSTNLSSQAIGPRLPLYEQLAEALGADPLGEVFLAAVASGDVQ
jgi:hypothetical protein